MSQHYFGFQTRKAKKHFGELVRKELKRVERMKQAKDWIDYQSLKPIIIGVVGGDGIGPHITADALRLATRRRTRRISFG